MYSRRVAAEGDIARLQEQLGYTFEDGELLERALTHKSFANENADLGRTDNERLEFLGDAVIDLIVGHLLMDAFPELREGELSMMRAAIVSESGLAVVARQLDLGHYLSLGKGESQTGGRDKSSLIADGLEAVIAAVYLDGGFAASHQMVSALFADQIANASMPGFSDFKTRLQELAQARYREPPYYEVVSETGPDHDKTFEVAVTLQARQLASAAGKSKKEAEQRAAEAALLVIGDA